MRRTLLGLDIGSTTTSAIVATARVAEAVPGGRMSLEEWTEVLRTPLSFTPFRDGELQVEELVARLENWLGGMDPLSFFGGGALITGLAARSHRASELAEALRARLGQALIATARDARLESWLAFMGNVSVRSNQFPDQWFLNVDIGGGTSNLALGRAGKVERTGCLSIGARHVRFEPGTWDVTWISPEARRVATGRSWCGRGSGCWKGRCRGWRWAMKGRCWKMRRWNGWKGVVQPWCSPEGSGNWFIA